MEDMTNKPAGEPTPKLGRKVSTESYKGVRDFYPEDMAVEHYMFEKMRGAAERFGYVEYNASVLEPADLYRSKTSEEIVNDQTYTFTDRGGREVTLRPEMTPTVARMVAARRRELSFPLRWYSIPNVFRYEQPQRGRLREHWQLNVDIFGLKSVHAEVEILAVAHNLFVSCGAQQSDFEIRVNSRALLEELWKVFDLTPEEKIAVVRLLDKKDKMNRGEFEDALATKIGDRAQKVMEAFESEENFAKALGKGGKNGAGGAVEAMKNLTDVMSYAKARGIENVKFFPALVRGFDYYTGFVFEIFDTNPDNRRSLCGGGRYDNLLSLFGVEPLTAVGFGIGDVTLRDFLESHNLMPALAGSTKLFIAVMGENAARADAIATQLRDAGISVAVDYTDRGIGDRIKKALKDGALYFTVIGDNEASSHTVTVKTLADQTEKTYNTQKKTDMTALVAELSGKKRSTKTKKTVATHAPEEKTEEVSGEQPEQAA